MTCPSIFTKATRSLICAAMLLTTLPPSAQAADTASASGRSSVKHQLLLVRRTLARLNRLALENNSTVKSGISDVQSSLNSLTTKVNSKLSPEPEPVQSVIGTNIPSSGYISFDIIPGVRPEAIVQHKDTGIAVFFKTYDGAKLLNSYSLSFPFAGRSSDQKNADTFMLKACLDQFNRVASAKDGGTFYIYPSADDKVGLLCSSSVM